MRYIINENVIITPEDLKAEMDIYNKKNYKEWDMMNNRVPLWDDPIVLLLHNKGFKKGDAVIFYDEKEREGVVDTNNRGVFVIRDINKNPWGIQGILRRKGGYIRKK